MSTHGVIIQELMDLRREVDAMKIVIRAAAGALGVVTESPLFAVRPEALDRLAEHQAPD